MDMKDIRHIRFRTNISFLKYQVLQHRSYRYKVMKLTWVFGWFFTKENLRWMRPLIVS